MSQTLKILFLDFSASTCLKLTYVYTKIKKKQKTTTYGVVILAEKLWKV